MRLLAVVLAVALGSAGCLQAGRDQASAGPAEEDDRDAAARLAALRLPVRPSGAHALAQLEAFTAVAPDRHDNSATHEAGRAWLERELSAAGLHVARQGFDGSTQLVGSGGVPGQNILAVKPGRDPQRILLFGAHYDGAVTGTRAAYDDGSGTVIVVELAQALAAYDWNHTLVFALWDQEEAGLLGSAAHVDALLAEGTAVTVAVNFDMTGINWPARFGGAVDVPLKADFGGPGDDELAGLWSAVADHLGHPPVARAIASGATGGASDHASFLAADLPAAWVRGAVIGNYPAYHTADTVEAMVADVGGDRAALEAGFGTALDTTFLFAFLVDALAPSAHP